MTIDAWTPLPEKREGVGGEGETEKQTLGCLPSHLTS